MSEDRERPLVDGFDATDARRLLGSAEFMHQVFVAVVAQLGGHVVVTHEQIGQAALAAHDGGIRITRMDGGVFVEAPLSADVPEAEQAEEDR